MNTGYHIVVCAGIVPDPLQVLEPATGPAGPSLKNEMMLPAVLDTWASHGLYQALHLAGQHPGSKVWLVSMAPRAKLQQVLMAVAQKGAFELVAVDGPASGFTDPYEVAGVLAEAVAGIAGLDRARLLVFGGWESGSRCAGVTLQVVGERLGITDQFYGVDEFKIMPDGAFEVWERIEGGKHLLSRCKAPPVVVGWATGNLPEPKNNPQIGMQNMRTLMPALQKARQATIKTEHLRFLSASVPTQIRNTRIVKDLTPDQIADELANWILRK